MYKNFTAQGFWENAKPSKVVGQLPAWMNFDDQWVDEVQRGIKACGVFLWFPIYCASPKPCDLTVANYHPREF